jgi:hypothetical protein
MPVTSACVDRGRQIIKEPSGPRVEGRTQFTPVAGPWFKCRLFYEGAPDTTDAQGAHFKSTPAPQVLTPAVDLMGNPLVFTDDTQLQVNSMELGNTIWRMAATAEPLRKRRRIIGYILTVERVIEHAYDDLLAQNAPTFGWGNHEDTNPTEPPVPQPVPGC